MSAVKFTVILLMCATLSWAGDTGGTRSGGKASVYSGEWKKHSSRRAYSVRDIARVTYPKKALELSVSSSDVRKISPRRVLLTMPRSFDREGFYIWRDIEGIWNIRCISTNRLNLTGEIVASDGILAVDPKDDALKASNYCEITINLSSEPSETLQTLQFKAKGSYVDFSLFIDGKNDPNHIYIGSCAFRPKFVHFRLENHPVVSFKDRAKSTVSQSRSLLQIRLHEQGTAYSSDESSNTVGGGSAGGSAYNPLKSDMARQDD